MNAPVKLYMRVENQEEICIGSVRRARDVPALLEGVAIMLRAGLQPDALEVAIDEMSRGSR